MQNIHYLKGALKTYNPQFDHWDAPVIRETKNQTIFGRPTRGFGDAPFKYAGKYMKPEPWTNHRCIPSIKANCEEIASTIYDRKIEFTFCLCGLYKDDGKGIPYHSDTVPTLEDVVMSISFGGPRVFAWRTYQNPIKKHTNTSDLDTGDVGKGYFKENFLEKETFYILEHGDVLLFDGASQMKSTHSVPDLPLAEERINLTFRTGL
jgi:alkylated DNA repair dioxygenase AlkB|tara:strand:+ start:9661 stop:10278 length:618 start_codon:yes stop_codon:yes gene_type:complete